MDSGIDSTESSNGSAEEMQGVMEAANNNNRSGVVLSSSSSSSSSPSLSSLSSSSSVGPSSLKYLAANTVTEGRNETPIHAKNNDVLTDAKNPDESNAPSRNLALTTNFPEESRLQLHFPSPNNGSFEDKGENTFDLDPPPGLTFANVSPSMCLSHGYEVYSQSYAVLPYEQNSIKKSPRYLKMKMERCHYKFRYGRNRQRKLRIAVGLNNTDSVKELLQEGVDPKVTDSRGRSSLHIAASKGYAEIAQLLLQYGADPNQKDAIGNTALHLAACTSNIPMVTLLLKAGTNVRQADNQGYSPLHLARSKLKLLQQDNSSCSSDIKKQVYQVIEMMQTYLECSGSAEEAELLNCFSSQLSLSDTRQDVQTLLDSLNNLSLTSNSSTTTTMTTTSTTTPNTFISTNTFFTTTINTIISTNTPFSTITTTTSSTSTSTSSSSSSSPFSRSSTSTTT